MATGPTEGSLHDLMNRIMLLYGHAAVRRGWLSIEVIAFYAHIWEIRQEFPELFPELPEGELTLEYMNLHIFPALQAFWNGFKAVFDEKANRIEISSLDGLRNIRSVLFWRGKAFVESMRPAVERFLAMLDEAEAETSEEGHGSQEIG